MTTYKPLVQYSTEVSQLAATDALEVSTIDTATLNLTGNLTVTEYITGYGGSPSDGEVLTWVTANGRFEALPASGNGTSNHSALTNLDSDDHTQYALVDGTRDFTGNVTINGSLTATGNLSVNLGSANIVSVSTALVTPAITSLTGTVNFDGDSIITTGNLDCNVAEVVRLSLVSGNIESATGTINCDDDDITTTGNISCNVAQSTSLSLSGYITGYGGTPSNNDVLTWVTANGRFEAQPASGGGVTDHGALTGLGEDDHTQYILVDGTRAFTGTVNGVTPTADEHLATKGYVDSINLADLPDVSVNTANLNGGETIVWDDTNSFWTVPNISIPTAYTLKTGWDLQYKDQVTLTFNDANRTFSIAPTGNSFTFWVVGKRFTKTTTQSVQIDDTAGMWYVTFNTAGELEVSQTPWEIQDDDAALVAYLYWDQPNGVHIGLGYELHSWAMDPGTHSALHNTVGAIYGSGFALGDITDGNGDDPEDAQCSVGNGIFYDEDIRHTVTNNSPQQIAFPAQLPFFYREGPTGIWRKKAATGYLGWADTANDTRLHYNEYTGNTWQLTEIGNVDFGLSHIFATNDTEEPVIVIIGQGDYTTLGNARDGAEVEINQLLLGDFAEVYKEFIPIATVILQTSTGYDNDIKSKVVKTNEGDDYVDWRGAASAQSAISGVTDHSLLSNLGEDDHTQYVLADGSRAFTGTVNGVTPTANEHLATKGYVDANDSDTTNHSDLTNLAADDHTQYVLANGTRTITTNNSVGLVLWDTGNNNLGSTNTCSVVIGGEDNTLNGTHSTLLAGDTNNMAESDFAAMIAGKENTMQAGSNGGAMFSGYQNTMNGANSFMLAGRENTINVGNSSGIAGGKSNTLNATSSVILGGDTNNIDDTINCAIVGGALNTINAASDECAIVGGIAQTITGNATRDAARSAQIASNNCTINGGSSSLIIAGLSHSITSNKATIIAGQSCSIIGDSTSSAILASNNSTTNGATLQSVILGGKEHSLDNVSTAAAIIGGQYHTINGGKTCAIISGNNVTIESGSGNAVSAGGRGHTINAGEAAIVGGYFNTVNTGAYQSAIIGGQEQEITPSSFSSFVASGYRNTVNSSRSAIIAGQNNEIHDTHSMIAGGRYNECNAKYQLTHGQFGVNDHFGSYVHSPARQSFSGDTQYIRAILTGTVSGGVSEDLTLDGVASANSTEHLVMPADCIWYITGKVSAMNFSGTNGAGYRFYTSIARYGTAAPAFMAVNTASSNPLYYLDFEGTAAYNMAVSLRTGNIVTVTASFSASARFIAVLDIVQVRT
jgi:hypothetical protein